MSKHPLDKWFEATGMSKTDFARAHGISRMSIYRVMAGHDRVSLGILRRISKATDIPLSRLLPPSADRPQEAVQ